MEKLKASNLKIKKINTKVCHISTVHSLYDIRIFYKECISLAKAGFDVSLIINAEKEQILEGVKIIPLKPTKNRLQRILIKPFSALQKALKTKAKIYHFHDPELIPLGIFLRLLGKKVIFDSHENVSHQIENKAWLGPLFLRKTVAFSYRLIEKIGIWSFNSVISVTPEIVQFLSPKKGVLISNYPIISMIENIKQSEKFETPTIIYAGGLTKIRGIFEVCKAVSLVNLPIQLILYGAWETEAYKKECLELDRYKIHYLGKIPLEEVYYNMKKAHIGVATFLPEKNHLNCLPNKIFEYMTCGIPIIVSDFPYWKNYYGNYAFFVDPNDPKKIKEAIELFFHNMNDYKKMGDIAYQEIKEKYSWESESKKLIQLYKELV